MLKNFKQTGSLARLLIVAALALTTFGCGGSIEQFVFTRPVVVPNGPDGAFLTPDNATLNLGQNQTYVLNLTFPDDSLSPATDVTYSSADPSIVTIDPDTGVATAIMVGTTTISATDGVFTDDTQVTVQAAPVNPLALDVFVSNNGGSVGDLDLFSALLAAVNSFVSGNNQGIAVDALGTGLHNGDTSINIISRAASRDGTPAFQSNMFDTDLDRNIDVSGIANVALKGSAFAQRAGVIIAANFSTGAPTASLVLIGSSGTTLTNIPTSDGRPWDAAYDEASDTLFVAFTNGSIGVFDDFLATNFITPAPLTVAADRVLTPAGLDNAHGISYDAASDTLVVSDVGVDTMPDTDDGEIYLLGSASTATGAVTPLAVIGGANTLLGNPVDIDLQGGDLRVAEKANQQILIFTSILTTPGGNIAPTQTLAYDAAESVTTAVQAPLLPDASDVEGNAAVQNLVVATNDGANDGTLVRVNPGLTSATEIFVVFGTAGVTESAAVDGQGDVYYTADSVIFALGRAANGTRDGEISDNNLDRNIVNNMDNKGLDIWDAGGLVFVADNDSNSVVVVGKHSTTIGATLDLGNVPAANARPWDCDYDPVGDDLYVACQDGTIRIFDNLVANNFTGTPTRVLTVPGGGNGVGLHGIIHDATNDRIIVSNVNVAATNDDGEIYLIEDVSTLTTGAVTIATTLGDVNGTNTNSALGNPVDIAYDGTFLYIADKNNNAGNVGFNGSIQRYDISVTFPSDDVASDASVGINDPESVSLNLTN